MSRYAYLICKDAKEMIFVGKAVFDSDGRTVNRYHQGSAEEPPNSQRETLNRVLWRFLARNAGKQLEILMDEDLDYLAELGEYREIGGDSEKDIPVEEYLRDWKG
jgi:hypothetical protein